MTQALREQIMARTGNAPIADLAAADAVIVREIVDDLVAVAGEIVDLDPGVPGVEVTATTWLSKGRAALKKLEDRRSSITLPMERKIRGVNDLFRTIRTAGELVVTAAEAKLIEWRQKEKERAAREEVARRAAEEARRREEQLVRCAAGSHDLTQFDGEGYCPACQKGLRKCSDGIVRDVDAAAAFDLLEQATRPDTAADETAAAPAEVLEAAFPAPIQAALETIAPPPLPPPAPARSGVVTDLGTSNVKDVLDYEVLDAWEVPRHLLKAPEVVKSLVKAEIARQAGPDLKRPVTIPGLRVFVRDKVDFRGR